MKYINILIVVCAVVLVILFIMGARLVINAEYQQVSKPLPMPVLAMEPAPR